MPKHSFDNFYATLREIHADFQKQIRTVMENPDLSEQGKARSISTIKAKRTELLVLIQQAYQMPGEAQVQTTRWDFCCLNHIKPVATREVSVECLSESNSFRLLG